MPSGDSERKREAKPRKKRKTKCSATSPLNENERPGVSSNGERSNNNEWKFINGAFVNNQSRQSSYNYSDCSSCGSNTYIPNMSFPQQSFGGFSFGNQGGR